MRKRLALTISLLMLLSSIVAIKQVGASPITVVGVDPDTITVQNVNDAFTVTINVTGVTNLYGYELQLFYNKTLLNATYCTLPSNHFLKPVNPSSFFVAANQTGVIHNTTHNYAWFAYILLGDEIPRNGSGVLVEINFKALAQGGPSKLELYVPDETYPVLLTTPDADIPCKATPSYVTVLPEFSTIILIVVLMAATSIAVIFGRTSWLKKRRGSFVAG